MKINTIFKYKKKKNSIDIAILKFIIGNFLPFTIIENRYFIELIIYFNKNFKPVSRNYLSNTLLQKAYESTVKNIKSFIEHAVHISITTDIWTSVHKITVKI